MTASALVSAGAAVMFMPSGGVVSMPFIPTAAINTSNTTVGFADSDVIGKTPAEIERTLDAMQAMGVNNVRILIPWNGIELADDFYYWDKVDYLVNAADSRGMGILGVLNSTPAWAVEPGRVPVASPPASDAEYAEFVGQVAARYAGKVSAYEVWNEPNAYTFWNPAPNPAEYTQLLQAAYPAIKAADPDATVIGGVVGWVTDYGNLTISPDRFVDGMYAAGAQGYFDALSYHPYHYTLPFSQGSRRSIWGNLGPLAQLQLMHESMVANGDGDKLIWASEYGQPTSQGGEVKQAMYIQDFLNTWSQQDYTGPSFIYTTRDRNTASTNSQDTLGVLRTDWTPKPAADVIRLWTALHPQTAPDPDILAAADASTMSVAPTEATAIPQTTAPTETVTVPTGVTAAEETAAEETAAAVETTTAGTEATAETTESTSTESTTTSEPTGAEDSTGATESASTESTSTSDSTGTADTADSTGTSDSSSTADTDSADASGSTSSSDSSDAAA